MRCIMITLLFQALNWMLHCVTQPTCFHDIMWWFNSAMEQYRPLIPEGAPHNASSHYIIEQKF